MNGSNKAVWAPRGALIWLLAGMTLSLVIFGAEPALADDITPPEAFSLVGPANGASGLPSSPTLSWHAANDADSGIKNYEVWVDGSKVKTITDASCSGGTCSTGVGPLSAGVQHSWQIVAVDQSDNSTGSDTWNFVVGTLDTTPPANFSLIYPSEGKNLFHADGDGIRQIDFSWEPATDAGSGLAWYQFWLDGSLVTNIYPSCGGLDGICRQSQNFYPPGPAAGPHTWQIVALDQADNSTTVTGHFNVVVDATPPFAFSLNSPVDNATDLTNTPTLSWSPTTDSGSGLDHYEIWIDGSKTKNVAASACSGGNCSSPVDPVTPGSHYWQIKAVDVVGNTAESAVRQFTTDMTPPTTPALTTPADGATEVPTSPTLSWQASADTGTGINHYVVSIDGSAVKDVATSACSTGNCSAAVGPLTGSTQHNWQVKAVDNAGNYQVSDLWTFTTRLFDETPPQSFTLISPIRGDDTGPNPTLKWNSTTDSGSGLAGYDVMIDGTRAGELDQSSCTGGTCSFRSGPLAAGFHMWFVIAKDNFGNQRSSGQDAFISGSESTTISVPQDLVFTGEQVHLQATYLDGDASSYEFDPEGDGTFDAPTTSNTVTHEYSEIGEYFPKVRVTDISGSSSISTSTQAVHVRIEPPKGHVGVSINDGDIYTNDPHVKIHAVWDEGRSFLFLSNDGGFRNPTDKQVAEVVNWTLVSSGPERLPKTVYVRFGDLDSDGNPAIDDTRTYTDDIILDETPPVIDSAVIGCCSAGASSASASWLAPSIMAPVAHHARVTKLKLKARDKTSGVGFVQTAIKKNKPSKKIRYKKVVKINGAAPKFVRVQDKAGNFSKWKKVKRR